MNVASGSVIKVLNCELKRSKVLYSTHAVHTHTVHTQLTHIYTQPSPTHTITQCTHTIHTLQVKYYNLMMIKLEHRPSQDSAPARLIQ